MPLVSIVVPAYNAESSLVRCLDSLLNQTYTDYEILIVNDGSTDNSLKILRDYELRDNRIVVIDKLNGGVSSARNAALDVAKGAWIAFCDSDDYADSDWLANFIDKNTAVDLLLQGIIYERDNKSKHHLLQQSYGNTIEAKQNLISDLISKGMYGYLFSKLFKRSIIENNNIRFNTISHFREDEEFFSTYLLYVKSWRSSDKAAYHYFLPDGTKIYKGNSYQSLVPIFKSLDIIFDGKYPSTIADTHFANIKDMIIYKCCANQIPSEYECNLFHRLLKVQTTVHGNSFVNSLIISTHNSELSRLAIRLLHSLISIVKRIRCITHQINTASIFIPYIKSLYSILRHQLVLGLLWSYKYIYTPIRVRKIRGKDKINVLFFLTSLGSWKTESLFRMMLTHPRFTPKILILKGVYFEDSRDILRKYCDKYGYPYDEIDETKENLQQKFHPDIIIYQKPYAGEYAESLEFKYNLKSLFIYIPYGMRNTTESWQWDTPLLKHCWQIYYENKSIYDEYRMLSKANKRSGRLTGTPVMDDLLIPRNKLIDPWILTVPSKKRIIYAPHHSFDPDNQFDTGTFLLIGEQMLELAKSVSDRVQWAFKPHPVLRKKMETYWSKEKIDRYFNEWDKLGQIVEGGYMELFKYSDAMIHDCGSFILEYHATGNPVLYIDKPGSRMNATWNSTTREAMNLHYHASTIDQIRNFIENVIDGVDIRKDERQGFLNNHFTPPFNQSACQNIIDCILYSHMDKKMHP